MKRVLIITYYWPPSGGAGVQRWLKFAKYLPENGWQPVIYTPENPEAPAEDLSLLKDIPPSCEVIKRRIFEPYSFYRIFTGRGSGEKVNAGFLDEGRSPGLKDKMAVWVRGNLFIPDARRFWIKPSIRFLQQYLKQHPVDVIVSTGPPHSMHLIARALKKRTGIPWVADFRDPWTGIDFYHQLMLSKYADKRHHKLEKEVLVAADRVVTVGWEGARELSEIGGRHVDVITNGYDQDDVADDEEFIDPVREDRDFVIRHVGAMNKDRNHDVFWRALREVNLDSGAKRKVRVELIGKSDAAVRKSIEKYDMLDYVEFISYIPHNKIGSLLKHADMLYLPINNTPNAKGILTGKIFEYLASGTPVLGVGPIDGDAARVLLESNAGQMFDFDDFEGVVAWMLDVNLSHFVGQKAQRNNNTDFQRKKLLKGYVDIFNELL